MPRKTSKTTKKTASKKATKKKVSTPKKAAKKAPKKATVKKTAAKKAPKKKAAKKKAVKRTKATTVERKRIYWGVFSGNLKEEARFPYAEKAEAEKKLAALKAKSKKLYFMQPVKEVLTAELLAKEKEDKEKAEAKK